MANSKYKSFIQLLFYLSAELPKGQGIRPVVQYLANMVDYEDNVRTALEYLVELAKEVEVFEIDASGKRMIKAAMRNNLLDKDIQIAGFNILNSLIITGRVVWIEL